MTNIDPVNYRKNDTLIMRSVLAPPVIHRSGAIAKHIVAEDITSDDDKTFSISLRGNEKWDSGSSLTAHDVQFSLMRFQDSAVQGSRKSYWSNLDSIEVEDDNQLKITLKSANKNLIETHLSGGVGCIVSKERLSREADKTFTVDPKATSGSYYLDGVSPYTQIIRLHCDDNWYGDNANYRKVEFHVIPDSDLRRGKIASGELDVDELDNPELITLPPGKIQALLDPGRRAVQIDIVSSGASIVLATNGLSGRLADQDARRALFQLIDPAFRPESLRLPVIAESKSLLPGFLDAPIPETVLPLDIEASARALAKKGIRKLTVRTGSDLASQAARMIVAAQLANAGITLEDFSTPNAQPTDDRLDLMILNYGGEARSIPDYLDRVARSPFYDIWNKVNPSIRKLASQPAVQAQEQEQIFSTLVEALDSEGLAKPLGEARRAWIRKSEIDIPYDLFGDIAHVAMVQRKG